MSTPITLIDYSYYVECRKSMLVQLSSPYEFRAHVLPAPQEPQWPRDVKTRAGLAHYSTRLQHDHSSSIQ